MPTYEYKCLQCGVIFEEFQKMTDSPLEKCPTCGGPVKRLISNGAGIVFKGSGFYQTDYKNSHFSGNGNGKKDKAEKPKTESAVTPKTENTSKSKSNN